MGSEESRAKVRQKRKRNQLAKALEDRRYRQRKVDRNYKIKKSRLQDSDHDEMDI